MNSWEQSYTTDEILEMIRNHDGKEVLNLQKCEIQNADISGWDIPENIDFEWSVFTNVSMTGTTFRKCNLNHVWFKECSTEGIRFLYCDVREANFRWMNFRGAVFSGSNFHHTLFEYANTEDITDNEDTKFFRMVCPETGPFIAWKCCTELRVVQLLVPADAKRVSATAETCRCNKAKVLSIKSIDETKSYDWAQSTVDPDFYYEVGKWVEPANGFEENRWRDSSQGIHFFMERQQAVDYQSK